MCYPSGDFGDRLTAANRRTGTVLCMGIDPHAAMIPSLFGTATATAGSDTAIRAIDDFVMACLETAIGRVAAIKPQAAFFEQQGPAGMALLQRLGRAAIDAGMLVIMDAKRGDIGTTEESDEDGLSQAEIDEWLSSVAATLSLKQKAADEEGMATTNCPSCSPVLVCRHPSNQGEAQQLCA